MQVTECCLTDGRVRYCLAVMKCMSGDWLLLLLLYEMVYETRETWYKVSCMGHAIADGGQSHISYFP